MALLSGNDIRDTVTRFTVLLMMVTQPPCLIHRHVSCLDCTAPTAPTNGQESHTAVIDASTVTYTCDVGYSMVGSATATCTAGAWSPAAPTCPQGNYNKQMMWDMSSNIQYTTWLRLVDAADRANSELDFTQLFLFLQKYSAFVEWETLANISEIFTKYAPNVVQTWEFSATSDVICGNGYIVLWRCSMKISVKMPGFVYNFIEKCWQL